MYKTYSLGVGVLFKYDSKIKAGFPNAALDGDRYRMCTGLKDGNETRIIVHASHILEEIQDETRTATADHPLWNVYPMFDWGDPL